MLTLAVLGIAGATGWWRGLVAQAGQIAALAAGVIFARLAGSTVAGVFGDGTSPLDCAAGYGIAFAAAYFAVRAFAGSLRKVVGKVHLGPLDRIGGAAFKMLLWGFFLSLGMNVVLSATGSEDKELTGLRRMTVDFAPAVMGYLSDIGNHKALRSVVSSKSDSN